MSELSRSTQKLLQKYEAWSQFLKPKAGVATIHVDELASRVAAFYEKIRGIIDWREEHLMKRGAIERNLRRRLLISREGKAIAEPLVLELIRGGYFPNDQIEESKIGEVEKILNKYIYILENSFNSHSEKIKLQFHNWILSIAACEIEEALSFSYKERAIIDYMMESMKEKITIEQGGALGEISEEIKDIELYIAVQRALFKLDDSIISYHLLKRRYQDWPDLTASKLQEITQNIYLIWQDLERNLRHPLADKFYSICERYDTPYLLIGDILSEENPEEIYQKFSQPEILEELIKKAYNRRLSTLKQRLARAAFFSTASIFITQGFSLIALEIPLAKLLTGTFLPITIVVDILGPTLLMFLLVATIKPPSKSNLETVLKETRKIVYEKEGKDIYKIKISTKKSFIIRFIINFLYVLGASASVGLIILIFKWANFPPTSVVINTIFVALIAFAGLAIRNRAEELTVEEKKTGFFSFLFDIFFLPLVSLGKWLSNKWKKYNAITIFFNALIDLPFQLFVEFLEQWRYFLKEKKEEIH